jgi:hypothetical protein
MARLVGAAIDSGALAYPRVPPSLAANGSEPPSEGAAIVTDFVLSGGAAHPIARFAPARFERSE